MDGGLSLAIFAVVLVGGFVALVAFLMWLFRKAVHRALGVHPRLEPYADQKNIDVFSRVLKRYERQLDRVGCRDWTVEVVFVGETPFWRKLWTSDISGIEQAMVISGEVEGRPFRVLQPMGRGKLFAYCVEIQLNVSIRFSATARRGMFGRRWEAEPSTDALLGSLKRLPVPKTSSTHHMPGYVEHLPFSHQLLPDEESPERTTWRAHSGYEGFLVGIGPRLAKFFAAAPAIEKRLQELAAEGERDEE